MDNAELFNLEPANSNFFIAAHEMKAPLSIVRQLSLTLSNEDIPLSSSDRARILSQISATSERALRLVQDLTKVASLEDALFEMSPISTRRVCKDIVREMADIYRISRKQIVVKKIAKNTDLAYANYDLLRSILLNFSDNALYSSHKKTKVEISTYYNKGKIRILVRDYGDEVPLNIWRAIKKEQNKPVKSGSSPESSGLGLFIAQNFANKMGGKIGLVRHRNGNTFFVELNKSEQLSLI